MSAVIGIRDCVFPGAHNRNGQSRYVSAAQFLGIRPPWSLLMRAELTVEHFGYVEDTPHVLLGYAIWAELCDFRRCDLNDPRPVWGEQPGLARIDAFSFQIVRARRYAVRR